MRDDALVMSQDPAPGLRHVRVGHAFGVTTPLERKLRDLPDSPGVYQFLDAKGKVIYVGKAKSLKRRVVQYFQAGRGQAERTRTLVADVRDVDWLSTANEIEALVLENSLIKKSNPRYNVRLRDDKNFPYIRITTSDRVPHMEIVRRPRRDDDEYFGPWVPAWRARKTMRLLAQHFGIRSCRGPIEEKDHRGCLYFHIDQCLAPCTKAVSAEEYDAAVRDALLFLRGNDRTLRDRLDERMRKAAGDERFERAAHYRDLLRMLERGREPQRIASTGLEQQDAWGMHREGPRAFLTVGFVRDGLLRGRREFALRDVGDMEDASLLGDAVRQYYHDAGFYPDDVLLPGPIDDEELTAEWLKEVAGRAARLSVPQRGDKAERVRWASENARVGFELRFARGDAARESAAHLAEALDLSGVPERIECFDVSHVQGSEIVASMVVFVNGEPSRRDYRKFRVRTVTTGQSDDFASMREVVSRRYRRLLEEGKDLPDLVVVDGGLGQLGAAAAALEEIELHELPLISLAKKEELIYRRGSIEPVRLERTHPGLQLVQRLRDEAHRFAVDFHRQQRKARTVTSALDAIPGIGATRRRQLLRTFGSVAGVRGASLEELAAVVGPKAARTVQQVLGPAAAQDSA
jgi:excinuclease ABC subunit C